MLERRTIDASPQDGPGGERTQKIRLITEVCRRVFGAPNLDEALQVAVRAVVDEYGYFCACVAFVEDESREMVHKTHYAKTEIKVPIGYRQKVGQGIVGIVAERRLSVCCNDTGSDPDYVPLLPGVRAELCVPLLAGSELIGVLDVNADTKDAFDGEDIFLMETLARQLALVMDKARYLQETERTRDYLENLIGNAGDGIVVFDAERRVTRWNRGMERILGYPFDEASGGVYEDLTANDSRTSGVIERCLAGETIEGLEDRFRTREGRRIDVALTLSPIQSPGGTVEGASMIVRDVTEKKRMEEDFRLMHRQIRESEEKFLGMIENADDAIFIVDPLTRTIAQANAAAEVLSGFNRSDLIGKPISSIHTESDWPNGEAHFAETLRTGEGKMVELDLVRNGQEPLAVEAVPRVLSYGGRNVVQWVCRDISARRRVEKEKDLLQLQLLQTEKLSAIGQLISGVAHELNNPLTGVIGYSQLLSSEDCSPKIRRGLEKVYSEARRCHRIVQNLLTFARKHTPEKTPISINDVLESTIELRSYQLRVDRIEVEKDLSRDIPLTMADFHQLQQVFMNIIINAHQAIKESGDRGRLMIRTRVQKKNIRIEIRDNGPGIPGEVLNRIFDPFFTTKTTGQGTGLGLSICYGIIEEHDGRIAVDSTPGRGTTFTIDLPVVKENRASAAAGELPASRPVGSGESGGRRLLVVDDEPSIVEILVESMKSCGHHVDQAVNGRLALAKIRAGAYDAVITDMKMPDMSGKDLYEEVCRLDAALAARFIFSTGDVITRETREFLESTGCPWIEKPFDITTLKQRLGEFLGGLKSAVSPSN